VVNDGLLMMNERLFVAHKHVVLNGLAQFVAHNGLSLFVEYDRLSLLVVN